MLVYSAGSMTRERFGGAVKRVTRADKPARSPTTVQKRTRPKHSNAELVLLGGLLSMWLLAGFALMPTAVRYSFHKMYFSLGSGC